MAMVQGRGHSNRQGRSGQDWMCCSDRARPQSTEGRAALDHSAHRCCDRPKAGRRVDGEHQQPTRCHHPQGLQEQVAEPEPACLRQVVDQGNYPQGLPGLPAHHRCKKGKEPVRQGVWGAHAGFLLCHWPRMDP